MRKLKIGLPKGSLQESTFRLFKKAGFNVPRALPRARLLDSKRCRGRVLLERRRVNGAKMNGEPGPSGSGELCVEC